MDSYITVKEVARKCYTTPTRVYEWIRKGYFNGAFSKKGRTYIFNEDALEKAVEDNFPHNDTVCYKITDDCID